MTTNERRRYHVILRDQAGYGRIIEAHSFDVAGLAFLEDCPPPGADVAVIIVRDEETGHEQCLRIDLASGDAEPCNSA
jgi:Family of unknown function (DUF5961)